MAGVPITKIFGSYPKILTNKEWQKKKGRIAKTKKTGIGAELEKAEKLFKAINLDKLDPNSSRAKSKKELDEKVKQSKLEYKSSVEPLRKQLKKVSSVAKDASGKIKKLPASGDTVKIIQQIEKESSNYDIFFKSLDLDAAIAEAEANIKKLNDLARKLLPQAIAKFEKGSQAFLSGDPTTESWNQNIKQQGRSVSNSVKQWEEYSDLFWSDWSKFQGFDLGTMKIASDSDADCAKRTKIVQLAQQQLTKIKAFKPTT